MYFFPNMVMKMLSLTKTSNVKQNDVSVSIFYKLHSWLETRLYFQPFQLKMLIEIKYLLQNSKFCILHEQQLILVHIKVSISWYGYNTYTTIQDGMKEESNKNKTI